MDMFLLAELFHPFLECNTFARGLVGGIDNVNLQQSTLLSYITELV